MEAVASSVPREVWMWMEAQICEGDGITRRQAQRILRPEEGRMRYVVAILREGERQDAMGRSRRVTRVLNYSEARQYSRGTTEVQELGEDRGCVHNTSQWGWRTYDVMKTW